MHISMYQASVPPITRQLENLSGILAKATVYAESKKIDPAVLISFRLYPDMFPLSRQVQIACDMGKACVARLSGVDVPSYEDNEKSFADLQARIAKTVNYMKGFTPSQIDGTEDRKISYTQHGMERNFIGLSYLLNYILPNVHFHCTTTYAILRHNGLEIGKKDYLGSF